MPDPPPRIDLTAVGLIIGPPTVGKPAATQYVWQRAEIVRHLGDSQYLVKVRYNNAIVNARLGWLAERIPKLQTVADERRARMEYCWNDVRFYESLVKNDLALLRAVSSAAYREAQQKVRDAEGAFRRGIPNTYADFQSKRNEVDDLGDDLLTEAAYAAELVPNDEDLRTIPLAKIAAFRVALDALVSAGCYTFVPNDPCREGSGDMSIGTLYAKGGKDTVSIAAAGVKSGPLDATESVDSADIAGEVVES